MGNNHSSSTNQERSLNRSKLISNFINKNDNLDSLNITEFHNNGNNIKVPLQMINTSSLNKVGGGVGGGVVKQSNAFNEQMIKHEIFNLLHDTEIQQYHYNNMKSAGILNNTDNHVITGGAVENEHVTANSDVSDAMNRIKQVIMAELGAANGTQQGGAVNSTDSDSNTNGCGCDSGNDGEKGYKHKCGSGSDNENGKKGKKVSKGSKKGKSGKKGGKKGEKGGNGDDSSSSSNSSSSDSSSSDNSDNSSEDGLKNSGKGLSIFPFNSSDVQSSEKNYRLMRRKI